jgi:hypothetical protein
MRKAQAEVDSVLSNGAITVESLKKLEYITSVIIISTSIYSIYHFSMDKCAPIPSCYQQQHIHGIHLLWNY